jgi:hypothetical protein
MIENNKFGPSIFHKNRFLEKMPLNKLNVEKLI